MESRNSIIAKNTIFLTIRMFVVLIITLFTTRVVLRSLGVVDFGVYNVVCGFVSMFAFLNTSMTNGIQRFYNYELGKAGERDINKVFTVALFIQLSLALLIVILTESVGIWYINNKMVIPADRLGAAKAIFQFSICSFLFVIMQSPFSALTMAHERMDFYAIVSVIDAVFKLVIALILPLFGTDLLIIYGFLQMLISAFNFFMYYIYDRKNFNSEIKTKKTNDKKLFTSMISFSGWNIFGSFSGMMKEQGINLILNLFFGPIVNAARGIAQQVNGAVKSLVANLSTAVRPQIIQSYASGETHRTMSLTFSISKISICVMYIVALPIALEIDYILELWLGGTAPDYTAVFIKIIMLTSFVETLNSSVSGVIHASGKMCTYQVVTSIISLLCLPAAYIGFKLGYSPNAAFWAIFCFSALSQVASLIIMKKIVDYSIKEYLSVILLPFAELVIVSFIFPVLAKHWMSEGLLRLIIVFAVSFITATPLVYLFVLNKDEKVIMKSLINKIIRK